MSLIPGTTIEYEMKKHDEITSAYSYTSHVTCWNDYELGVNNNPVIRWTYPNEIIVTTEGSSEVYADIIWIYDENNSYLQEGVLINAQSTDTLPVITKLDIQKYKLVIDSLLTTNATPTGVSSVTNTRSPGYELQANEYIKKVTYHWTDRDETEGPLDRIKPVLRFVVNGEVWYFYINGLFETYIRNIPNGGNKLDATNPYGANMPHDVATTLFHSPAASSFNIPMPTLGHSFFCGGNTDYAVIFSNVDNSTNLLCSLVSSVDCMLRIVATLGIYFEYDGTIYLGFMDSTGQTTGEYLEEDKWNTSAQWQSENINNYTEHTPPYVPPELPGDNFDAMVTGFSNNIGGAAKYWLLPSEPSGLFEDFFLHAPQGSSITQNILSCYVSALKYDWQTVSHKMVIYTNGSQKPAFESQATYEYIYQSNPHAVLGSFDVPRRTNTFYDFSPYTTYEVYIPFCGWIGLPDIVAGRSIRVYMDFDASICTCKARVECEANDKNVIVGEISGTFGSPCPIQVTEGGLYRQAAINSALQIASGVASGTLGAATKHGGPLAIGGFSYALQGLTNAATAGNTNYSQTIGRTGDSSNLAGTSHYCYLRITHPEIDEVVNNTRFGHTVGYLCNTIGKIGDFEGFTVCGNPHITGIDCTESEKEEIKRMLEDGIIVNKVE